MALMDNKCCIITGGAGSLGLASAKLLLGEGARVLLVDRSQEDLDRAAKGLDENKVLTVAADVTDAGQTQAYIGKAIDAWGQLDVLFSNAGLSGTNAPITDILKTYSMMSWRLT